MYKINIDNQVFLASNGEKLSEVLIKNNMMVEHPCGGRGICQKCKVVVNGKEELSCKYIVTSDIQVSLPRMDKIASQTGGSETGCFTDNMCYALDIGTTTLALALVSLDENKIVKVITATNPQRLYGADVMTRIDYCRKNSVKNLHGVLVDKINKMTESFNLFKDLKMYISGNTTMLHILFGFDPSGIGFAPYTPAFLESKSEQGEFLGIKGVTEIQSLPSVSSFVGADLVAGMNYACMPQKDKYNLLIDLGTNAEIVLYSKEKMLCTAAAAGPCFEGANITCGMSATDGAVYSFSLENDIPHVQTIAKGQVKGICGTGLVDMIAELVKNGIIDKTGLMECEKYSITNSVFLNQKDVRQFQLAKSAVHSAIITLMKMQNISFDEIEKMYISGGFSAKINVENACITGLLPMKLKEKCVAINNSSLLGTIKYACEQNDLSQYLANAKYVDLSLNSIFTELYLDNMEF